MSFKNKFITVFSLSVFFTFLVIIFDEIFLLVNPFLVIVVSYIAILAQVFYKEGNKKMAITTILMLIISILFTAVTVFFINSALLDSTNDKERIEKFYTAFVVITNLLFIIDGIKGLATIFISSSFLNKPICKQKLDN